MGFYNIYTEGQQAEEYKARKAKEAEEEKQKAIDYYKGGRLTRNEDLIPVLRDENRRLSDIVSTIHTVRDDKNSGKATKKDVDKYVDKYMEKYKNLRNAGYHHSFPKEGIKAGDGYVQKTSDYTYKQDLAAAAIAKDKRRHPDRWKRGEDGQLHREQGIFESVEFLND